jgi:sec-independent protein translocase protein TatA
MSKFKGGYMFSGGIGLVEILIIFFIVFIIFGAGKLPQLGEGLGKGIRSFKKEIECSKK